ncbi:MAG: alpha-amylase family glycosyl hydrolase [Ferruginibacter sp.]
MRKNYLLYILSLVFGLIINTSCNDQKTKEAEAEVPVETSVHPAWSAQTNIYEVNLRQFSKAGTIMAFEKDLPRLKEMGVEVLWFMPITPIGVEGRKMTAADMGSYYAVKDYKGFNPEFGTMDDWKAFVKHAHDMGFKVITDWVANHSAPDNHWMKAHPDFYAKDSAGKLIAPYDWTDVRKLNYANRELRDSMIDAMKFWVTETGIDGFRCDVADDVPIDFWAACIAELKKIKHVFMLAEGKNMELYDAGFDETYAWDIMHAMADVYSGKKTVLQFDSLINADIARYPKTAYRLFFTTNHDENSWNGTEFEKYGDAYKTFAVFTQTMYQSVPLIYNGQEDINKKRLKFFVKDTIPWEGEKEMAPFYKTMIGLRRSNAALAADAAYKKLTSTEDASVFAYQREKEGHKVLVILNLSKQAQKFTIKDASINGEPLNIFMGVKEKVSDTHEFSIEPWGYIVYDYR